MRVAVEISANANADLKLPRRLRFECEPSITQCPTPLLIGYKTLVGTGLLDIVLGIESYEREIDADGLDIQCDWPEPDEGCEWPTLVGTKRLAGAKYFATADARSGYHQMHGHSHDWD